MWWGTRRIWAGIALLCLCAIAPAQTMRFSVQQVWSGLNSSQWNPYYANIENQGSSENAILTTSTDDQQTNIEYPVELPTGSKKRVLFLMGGYNDGKVHLRLPSGTQDATVKISYGSEQSRIGLISDNPSDLIFLKGQSSSGTDNGNNAIGVGGCIPDDAPDRLMGYECLDALVLGDGTERLRDDQIHAIRQYVLTGGSLLFIGGAAPSASSDPRWRDILPINDSSVVTRNGLTERIGKMATNSKALDVTKGKAFTRSYGMGLVAILSVNPFESPIRESEDRRSIVAKALQRNHHSQIEQMLYAQIGQGNDDYSSYAYSGTAVAPRAVRMSTAGTPVPAPRVAAPPPREDPFQTKPPSITDIMWILIAYTIIVVPINFLILRKMNKLEFAWITTPIISIVFSAILLNSTIGLYKASATTRTTSIAVVDASSPESIAFGRSEMFFPRAKSYDLQLHGVENILQEGGYGGYDRYNKGGINLIDSGREIIAPQVNTGNLAFKELSYTQSGDELSGLKVSLERKNGSSYVRIHNQTHTTVGGIIVYGPGNEKQHQEPIASGASADIILDDIIKTKPQGKDQSTLTWQNIAATMPNRIVLFATLGDMHVGPRYGEGHPASLFSFVCAPHWEEK